MLLSIATRLPTLNLLLLKATRFSLAFADSRGLGTGVLKLDAKLTALSAVLMLADLGMAPSWRS
jgi:hypothetical protein